MEWHLTHLSLLNTKQTETTLLIWTECRMLAKNNSCILNLFLKVIHHARLFSIFVHAKVVVRWDVLDFESHR